MKSFYIVLAALSGIYLLAQLVAWIFYGKVFFPDAGELFEKKKNPDLWQTVFPKNMLRLIISVFVASIAGLLMDTAGLAGWMSLLFAAVAGIFFNFLVSVLFSPIYLKFHKSSEPSETELEGLSGKVIEDIETDGFGVIEVVHGTRSYLFRAVSANGRIIPRGSRVIVIYARDSCCFVESEEHFCDILFEEDEEITSDEDISDKKYEKPLDKTNNV